MTAGMLVLLGPLPPLAMFAVITAGMIYNFRGKKEPVPKVTKVTRMCHPEAQPKDLAGETKRFFAPLRMTASLSL